jgi:autotransporter-associated beta strand protein
MKKTKLWLALGATLALTLPLHAIADSSFIVDGVTFDFASDADIGSNTGLLLKNGGALNLTGNGQTYLTGKTFTLDGEGFVFSERDNQIASPVTGTGNLTKRGAGILTLAAAPALSGSIKIAEGGVRLAGNQAASGTSFAISRNATLELASGLALTGAISGDGKLVAAHSGSSVSFKASTENFNGDIDFQSGTVDFNQVALGKTDTSSGESNYGGAIHIGNGSAVGFSGKAIKQTLSGALSGNGRLDLTFSNSALTLSGDNAAFSGAIGIGNQGTLAIFEEKNLGAAKVSISNGSLKLAGSAVFNNLDVAMNGANATIDSAKDNTLGAFSIANSNTAFKKTGAGVLAFAGEFTHRGSSLTVSEGELRLNGLLSGSGSGNFDKVVDVAQNATLSFAGDGDQTLSGSVSLGADATLSFEGKGKKNLSGSLSGSGKVVFKGSDTLTIGNASNDFNGDFDVQSGKLVIAGGLSGIIGATFFNGGFHIGKDAILEIAQDNSVVHGQTLDGALSGTGKLIKSGDAELTLKGDKTFDGDIQLLDGQLDIRDSLGGQEKLAGGDVRATYSGSILNSGSLMFTGSAEQFVLKEMKGSGELTKSGFGDLILDGGLNRSGSEKGDIEHFRGRLAISGTGNRAREVSLKKSSQLALMLDEDAVALSVDFLDFEKDYSSSATLDILGVDTEHLTSGQMSSPWTLIQSQTAIIGFDPLNTPVTVGGQNSADFMTAQATLSSDQKSILVQAVLAWYSNNPSFKAHGDFTIDGDGIFEIGKLEDNANSGNLSGASNPKGAWDGKTLTKKGTGTLALLEENTFSGGTVVEAGRLVFLEDGNVASGIEVKQGAFVEFNYIADKTFSQIISGEGAVVKNGDAVLMLESDQRYTGGTQVMEGKLVLAPSANLASGVSVVNEASVEISSSVDGTLTLADSATAELKATGIVRSTLDMKDGTSAKIAGEVLDKITLANDARAEIAESGVARTDVTLSDQSYIEVAGRIEGRLSLANDATAVIAKTGVIGNSAIVGSLLTLDDNAKAFIEGKVENSTSLQGKSCLELAAGASLQNVWLFEQSQSVIKGDVLGDMGLTDQARTRIEGTAGLVMVQKESSLYLTDSGVVRLVTLWDDATAVIEGKVTGDVELNDAPVSPLALASPSSSATLRLEGGSIEGDLTALPGGHLHIFQKSRIGKDLNADGANIEIHENTSIGDDFIAPNANLAFWFPFDAQDGDTVVSVGGLANVEGAKVALATSGGADLSRMIDGGVLKLLQTGKGVLSDGIVVETPFKVGSTLEYKAYVQVEGDDLVARFEAPPKKEESGEKGGGGQGGNGAPDGKNPGGGGSGKIPGRALPEAKAISEGWLAGAAFLTLADSLALEAMHDIAPDGSFGKMSAGRAKWDSGSSIKTDGVNLVAGISGNLGANAKFGAFFEYGRADADTRNAFQSGDILGDSDLHYEGAGLLAQKKFMLDGGDYWFVDAIARMGRLDVKFDTRDLTDVRGIYAKYHGDPMYFGAGLSVGQHFKAGKSLDAEVFAKFKWARVSAETAKLSTGETLRFEQLDTTRVALGARLKHPVAEQVSVFSGIEAEYEFDGVAKASSNGYRIDRPDLKGFTGAVEAGLSMTPALGTPFFIDLGVAGSAGKRESIGGTLKLRYEW